MAVKDYEYDAVDRLSIVTDQLPDTEGGARSTKTEYYPDGKTHRIIRNFGGALQQDFSTFTYTENGVEETVADALGNLTTYEYDGFDRLGSTRYPDPTQTGQSSTSDKDDFTYDANGNLKTWRRRSGEFLAYVYDDLNRIVEKQLLVAQRFNALYSGVL